MAKIELLTFEVTFFKEGSEPKPVTFGGVKVDRDYYDDPKDAAIDHYTQNVHDVRKDCGLEGYLPKFKTFRVLRCVVPSDLGLN